MNSELQKIATQLHYMNSGNAMVYLKQWFGAKNMEKRERLLAKLGFGNRHPFVVDARMWEVDDGSDDSDSDHALEYS